MFTVSFQGTRTTGVIGVPATACSRCTRSIRSSGVCSMSSTAQSKPATPTASATMGLADITQVPSGVCVVRSASSCLKRFMVDLGRGA
jgi:hypothetical protein